MPSREFGRQASDQLTTDVGGLIRLLRRNIWSILFATVVGLGLALTYLAFASPRYTATTSLFIDPRYRKIVAEEVRQGGLGGDTALLESQVSLIRSDAILRRVVIKERLAEDPEYVSRGSGLRSRIRDLLGLSRPETDAMTQAISTLAKQVRVRRAQKTYVIDIDVISSNPVKAARLSESIADAYLADQRDAKSEDAKRANALIDARLDELKAQLVRAETRVEDFKKANRILRSEGGLVNEQQLTRLNTELINARTLAADARARLDQVNKVLRSGEGPETLPEALRSGLIQRLREQYAAVARREASLAAQLGPRHPVLIDARSQLREVRSQITAELQRIAASAKSEYAVAAAREQELARQLESSKTEAVSSNAAQIKLRELEREAEASRELVRSFLARAKETNEQRNLTIADARIITPSAVPMKPSWPIGWLVLALGGFIGLSAGLARAFVSDYLDDSVRQGEVFAARPGLPTIASIPRLASIGAITRVGRNLRPGGTSGQAAFVDMMKALKPDTARASDGPFRQAVLRLLGRFRSEARVGHPTVVMLASAHSGAGVSSTALGMAYASALSGDRTLLVDACSANPELSRAFAGRIEQDRPCVLDNKNDLTSILARDTSSGLHLLPIALADLRALQTSQRQRFAQGLDQLSRDYDFVFIDAGSPLEDEAVLTLARNVDAILLVAQSDVTRQPALGEVARSFDSVRERVRGVVLTRT